MKSQVMSKPRNKNSHQKEFKYSLSYGIQCTANIKASLKNLQHLNKKYWKKKNAKITQHDDLYFLHVIKVLLLTFTFLPNGNALFIMKCLVTYIMGNGNQPSISNHDIPLFLCFLTFLFSSIYFYWLLLLLCQKSRSDYDQLDRKCTYHLSIT